MGALRWAAGCCLLSGAAAAQLPPEPPLQSLLKPQALTTPNALAPVNPLGSNRPFGAPGPLVPSESLLSTDAGGRGTPCARPGQSAAPSRRPGGPAARPTAGTIGGGSGPGEYGRFITSPGAPTAPAAPTVTGAPTGPSSPPRPSMPSSGLAGGMADRPLYGGVAAPLWSTGPGAAVPDPPRANPADRPLVNDGLASAAPLPPCEPASGRLGDPLLGSPQRR